MATTTTVNPTSDNWLNSGSVTTNYGSASTFQAGISGGSLLKKHAILEFDVSAITKPSDITSSNLTLVATSSGGGGTNDLTLQRLTQSFGETTSNWNTYDGSNAWTTAGASGDVVAGEPTYTVSVGTTTDIVVDIKELVIDAINRRSGILRIVIYFDGTPSNGGFTRFGARNHGTASNHPKVEIVTARRAVWVGDVDSNLDNANNWDAPLAGIPGAGDIAIFSSGSADVTRGSISCNKAYIGKNYSGDIGSSASHTPFEVEELHLSSSGSGIYIDLNRSKPTVAEVSINDTNANACYLGGKYNATIRRTRHTIQLDTEETARIDAHGRGASIRCTDSVADIRVSGGRAILDDNGDNVQICNNANVEISNIDNDDGNITIASRARVNFLGSLADAVVIFDGDLDLRGNEKASVSFGGLDVYRGGMADTRTGAATFKSSVSNAYIYGGRILLDGAQDISIT